MEASTTRGRTRGRVRRSHLIYGVMRSNKSNTHASHVTHEVSPYLSMPWRNKLLDFLGTAVCWYGVHVYMASSISFGPIYARNKNHWRTSSVKIKNIYRSGFTLSRNEEVLWLALERQKTRHSSRKQRVWARLLLAATRANKQDALCPLSFREETRVARSACQPLNFIHSLSPTTYDRKSFGDIG